MDQTHPSNPPHTHTPTAQNNTTQSSTTNTLIPPSSVSDVLVGIDRNELVIPGLVGDPFLGYDVDEEAGYLLTGSAGGSVGLWRLDHVSRLLLPVAREGVDSSNSINNPQQISQRSSQSNSNLSNEIRCRVLAGTSDEGVKYAFMRDDQVFAVVGDQHVKIWGSYYDATSQQKRFDRAHNYKTCKETYTFRYGMNILVITVNSNDGVILDLETMLQTPFKLSIPAHSVPVYFDASHLILLQTSYEGVKLVQLYEMLSERLVKTLVLMNKKQIYWGFQLIHHPQVSSTSSSSSSSSSPSPATSIHLLTYISGNQTIKCVPFESIPSGVTLANLDSTQDRPSSGTLYTHRIKAATHSARILAYIYDQPTKTFIVLTNDSKVKIFALEDAMSGAVKVSPGRLLKKYRNIGGTFKLGYPYILKKVSETTLLYTADEGIFILRLD